MTSPSEDEIRNEAADEFEKKPERLARDIIREANTLPREALIKADFPIFSFCGLKCDRSGGRGRLAAPVGRPVPARTK